MPRGGRTEITMEKKTIGKFIAALRRASGMTQRELGEKLFVSDKTVSRWECDECTPELSLIPTIAEIFGITTDELLRGERNNPERLAAETEEASARQKAKSERQFCLMLDRNGRKYKNFTLIPVGVTILGLIAAMIANLGFSRAWVAFFLAAAFCVASEICQICFAMCARVMTDEDDDTYTERILAFNTEVTETAVKLSLLNILTFAFCLPLIALVEYSNWGLAFEDWLFWGGFICLPAAFIIAYIFYNLSVRDALCKRGYLVISDEKKNMFSKKRKLLVKTVCIAVPVALVLTAVLIMWNEFGSELYWQYTKKEYVFDNAADFKAFMENEYDEWYREGYSHIDENGNEIIHEPIGGSYPRKSYHRVYNTDGKLLFEYYRNDSFYESVRFTESADDMMPVTVIPSKSRANFYRTNANVKDALAALIVLDLLTALTVYAVKASKIKKKYGET
jgi:transcriptional regulator with XRE-family HTH domain